MCPRPPPRDLFNILWPGPWGAEGYTEDSPCMYTGTYTHQPLNLSTCCRRLLLTPAGNSHSCVSLHGPGKPAIGHSAPHPAQRRPMIEGHLGLTGWRSSSRCFPDRKNPERCRFGRIVVENVRIGRRGEDAASIAPLCNIESRIRSGVSLIVNTMSE